MTATPWGFRDILPEEAQAREEIALTVKGCFREHHYLPVETPLLEDKGSLEEGGRIADTPFKLFDDDGRLLVVRPDNTLPIVRLVSTRMRAADLPLRLRYEAPVVRECQRNAGGSRQFTQLGFELIGAGDTAGDVEIVSLVAEAVRKLALPAARIIAGSVRPFKELLAACEDRELAAEALRCVHANDFVGLDARVAASAESDAVKVAISELPRLHGGAEVLDRVDALLAAAGIVAPLTRELRALVEGLAPEDAQVLSFDFSIMNSFDYYTGLVFKAYAGGLPDPVGSGGRYDSIFTGAFGDGIEVPAAGFAFSLERLEAAHTSAEDAASDGDHAAGRGAEGPLRIAVPKGSLNPDSIACLAACGLDTTGLADPGRQLIIRNPGVEYIIVRPSDAPVFVELGAADCGICGEDSLLEAATGTVELVDLKFGACRFIVAEPEGANERVAEHYRTCGSIRVATKYPCITESYYARKGEQVEIVKLHGNIELGPLTGLSERIVDITATGRTLRENNLVIVDEVLSSTARFFANPCAFRTDPRVVELADKLRAGAEAGLWDATVIAGSDQPSASA